MIGIIVIGVLIFGGYKLVQWTKENTELNLSGKNIAIVIGIAFLALVKWAYSSGSTTKSVNGTWQRTYQCKNCHRQITTMYNPKETEKTPCSGGYQHRWQKIN